jgi:DNA-binding MltR family transcriptional regulator
MSKDIIPIEDLSEQSNEVYQVVNGEPDLACVLILASYLDQCLASLLKNYFINNSSTVDRLLDAVHGNLGTFQARADLTYSLGLIPKGIYQNLCEMGSIRNHFAHSHLEINFRNKEIIEKVNSLVLPTIDFYISSSDEEEKRKIPFSQIIPQLDQNPRLKFNILAVMMADRILLIGSQTMNRSREEEGW